MLSKIHLPHLTEETAEQYAMGRLSEPEIEAVEEHLFVCAECQDLVTEAEDFSRVARIATQELLNEPKQAPVREAWWSRLFTPTPLFAAVACAALAFFVIVPRSTQTAVVDLQAMRGPETAAPAPSNADLTLRLSLRGLDVIEPLRVEVADASGNIAMKVDAVATSGELAVAKVEKLPTGVYWVRLYSGDEILREYGLNVR